MTNHFLTISSNNELLRVPVQHILYAQSDGNYCSLFLSNGREVLLTMQLGKLEQLLEQCRTALPKEYEPQESFVRIGRSLIINLQFVFLINPTKTQLQLMDTNLTMHDLKASKEALIQLKNYLEQA